MSYPFVAAKFDYGPRRSPALGLCLHMAEGGGTVGYLSRNPPRGVSVHFVIEGSGRVVQMLPLDHVSGSLNPADRSTDKGYYGHSTLVDVLGSYWRDPNVAVISVEIEGFASAGPNAAQIVAAIAWGLDMRLKAPTLRGAIGHADQTDTKRCPGTSASMKAIFEGIGGHGLFTATTDTAAGDDVRFINSEGYDVKSGKLLPVKANTAWQTLDGKAGGTFSADAKVPVVGRVDAHTGQYAVLLNTGSGVIYPDNVTRPTIVLVPSTAALLDAPATPPVTPTTATTLAPGLYEVKAA